MVKRLFSTIFDGLTSDRLYSAAGARRLMMLINGLQKVGLLEEDRYFRIEVQFCAPQPYPILTLIIDICAPRQEADALLGDLEEGFKKRARKQGRTYAHAWYASQALRSVGPLLWAAGKRVLGITAVSEFLKRIG